MNRVLVSTLGVILLLVGCTSDRVVVEELQSEISALKIQNANLEAKNAQLEKRLLALETQIAEKGVTPDKSEAIADFTQEALALQSIFMDIRNKWVLWSQANLPDNYPRYTTRDKELEAIEEAQKLAYEVNNIISSIEQLYAPQEAIETKKELLSEGDLLQQAFIDIINFYAAPDSQPPSLYDEAWKFVYDDLPEIDRTVRRELIDLQLEYGQ